MILPFVRLSLQTDAWLAAQRARTQECELATFDMLNHVLANPSVEASIDIYRFSKHVEGHARHVLTAGRSTHAFVGLWCVQQKFALQRKLPRVGQPAYRVSISKVDSFQCSERIEGCPRGFMDARVDFAVRSRSERSSVLPSRQIE